MAWAALAKPGVPLIIKAAGQGWWRSAPPPGTRLGHTEPKPRACCRAGFVHPALAGCSSVPDPEGWISPWPWPVLTQSALSDGNSLSANNGII